MTEKELDCWLGFSSFPGIGPLRFKLLLKYFGSAQKAWNVPGRTLEKVGLGEKISEHFVAFRETFSPDNYRNELLHKDIWILTIKDKDYPPPLKEIATAPFLLYVRGKKDFKWDWNRMIGVVGTRKITHYGEMVTEMITRQLIDSDITIVSGMAMGVDGKAHETAIAGGGQTIAVLGCGVDIVHPKINSTIYWKIVRGAGWVISEFPVAQFATKGLFPARNRIISGLSRGVVVTEGASDSGALITARYALDQGREVFAVPGPITSSLSEGPTRLLKDGAKLVTGAKDILDELNIKNNPITSRLSGIHDSVSLNNSSTASGHSINNPINKIITQLTIEEKKIIELLAREGMHFDVLVRESGIPSDKLGGFLTGMELKGWVRQVSGIYQIIAQ